MHALVCGGVSLSVAAVFVPTLQCEWKLSDTEVAIIPLVSPNCNLTSVDAGASLGASLRELAAM